jgi:hypothetical protein
MHGEYKVKQRSYFKVYFYHKTNFRQKSQTGSATTHPSLLLNGYSGFSLGLKRLEREGNPSLPSIAEVKNEWDHTFCTLPYC